MKRIITLVAIVCMAMTGFAQDAPSDIKDTIVKPDNDTIRVGNMIIVRSGKDRGNSYFDSTLKHFRSDNPNLTTNWMIIDFGLCQVNDQTNYPNAISNGILPAGASKFWFDQREWKSTNFNIWFFIQRLNMIKHVVNLKYGLGIELNNYRYTENIHYQKNSIQPFVLMDTIEYHKNKLAADYITVPLMINFNITPHAKHGLGVSLGVSAGYLYSSRQKFVSDENGKEKEREDFDLRNFKWSYIGELGIGPVRLYASYAMQSMFQSTLDQTPFTFGVRFSNW